MKSLRIPAFMLALGAFSICSNPAHAQQEVDPDHFDQPSAFSTHVQSSRLRSHHSTAAAQRRIADPGTVKPPIVIVGAKAPTKPSPVAHAAENTIADASTAQPPIVIIAPRDPKKHRPVAHESKTQLRMVRLNHRS